MASPYIPWDGRPWFHRAWVSKDRMHQVVSCFGFRDFIAVEEVYPRVKVKEQDDPIAVQEDTTLYLLRVIESLSLESHCSSRVPTSVPGSVQKNYSPPSCARISKSYHKDSLMPSISTSKVTGKNQKIDDGHDKTNIRASSVPRPRAVLSSPDNDDMIGNQNQSIRERKTIEKKPILNQNVHAKCKLTHKTARTESPLRTNQTSNESESKHCHLKEKKQGSQLAPPKQRVLNRKS